MVRIGTFAAVGAIALQVFAATSVSAQQTAMPREQGLRGLSALITTLQTNLTLQNYREALQREFAQLDATVDGKLENKDVELHTVMESAQHRSQMAVGIMRYDVDGDGFVTADEVRAATSYFGRLAGARADVRRRMEFDRQIDQTTAMVMQADLNKDGKISYDEASVSREGPQRPRAAHLGISGRLQQLLEFEKAPIDIERLTALGEELFRLVDSNNNGAVTQQELVDFAQRPSPATAAANPPIDDLLRRAKAIDAQRQKQVAESMGCEMHAPSPKSKVIFLSAYQSDTLSNVTLGSSDNVIQAGRIAVEEGSDPVYLIVTSLRRLSGSSAAT